MTCIHCPHYTYNIFVFDIMSYLVCDWSHICLMFKKLVPNDQVTSPEICLFKEPNEVPDRDICTIEK